MAIIVFLVLLVLLALASARWGVDSRDERFSVGKMLDRDHRYDR